MKAKKRAKKAQRKMPYKGVGRRSNGSLDFSKTDLAKSLKKHGKYMPHGYEIKISVVKSNKNKK